MYYYTTQQAAQQAAQQWAESRRTDWTVTGPVESQVSA